MTITTPGSRLKLLLSGVSEVDDGITDAEDVASDSNFSYVPPGFVYAEVVPESVTGTFTFSPTVTRFGMVADGTIEFRAGEVVGVKSKGSKAILDKVTATASKGAKKASSITIGLNPSMKYGYGQNGNSAGVVGLRILGANFTAKSPSVRVKGKTLVARGRI